MNRVTQSNHPSIEDLPVFELKTIPSHMWYVFLGADNTFSVIIMENLVNTFVKVLISVLRWFKKTIKWTIADIVGIPLLFYTHKILFEPDCVPRIEHQHHLNPTMQEVAKKL